MLFTTLCPPADPLDSHGLSPGGFSPSFPHLGRGFPRSFPHPILALFPPPLAARIAGLTCPPRRRSHAIPGGSSRGLSGSSSSLAGRGWRPPHREGNRP